jgi:hypothetical protein
MRLSRGRKEMNVQITQIEPHGRSVVIKDPFGDDGREQVEAANDVHEPEYVQYRRKWQRKQGFDGGSVFRTESGCEINQ